MQKPNKWKSIVLDILIVLPCVLVDAVLLGSLVWCRMHMAHSFADILCLACVLLGIVTTVFYCSANALYFHFLPIRNREGKALGIKERMDRCLDILPRWSKWLIGIYSLVKIIIGMVASRIFLVAERETAFLQIAVFCVLAVRCMDLLQAVGILAHRQGQRQDKQGV